MASKRKKGEGVIASYDWQQLLDQAAEAGVEYELQPPGEYQTEVASVKIGSSQGGKDQVGIQHKILEGPRASKSFWDNITVSPENPKAMAVFFRKVSNYGGDVSLLATHGLEGVAQMFVGTRGKVNLAHRTYNGKTYHDVKSFTPTPGVPGAVASPVVPAPAAPATPAAAVPPQPAPAAAPAAVVAAPAVPF